MSVKPSPNPQKAGAGIRSSRIFQFFTGSLYIITAFTTLGYGLVLTLFAELEEQYGFSGSDLGIVAGSSFMSGFAAQVWLSRYSDRGHASLMVKLSMVAAAAGMFWMAFTEELWQFVAARALWGLAAGTVVPAVRRVIICRDEKNMGANLGRLAAYDIAGFTFGPVLSVVLLELGDIRTPFIFLGFCYVALWFVVNRLDLSVDVAPLKSKKVVRELLRLPGIQSGLAMAAAFYATIGAFEVSWALLLDDLGAGTWLIGISLSLFIVPMIFIAPRSGKLSQKIGPMRVMSYSVMAAMLCTLSYGWIDYLWVLLAISVVHGIFDAFTLPSLQLNAAIYSPENLIASGQGLLGASGLLVAGIISLVGGTLYEQGGPEAIFSATAGLMIAAVIFAVLRNPKAQPSNGKTLPAT